MRVLIGSDHAGYGLKQQLSDLMTNELGHAVEDVGTHSEDSCDYPEYAQAVARGVTARQADLGVLVCGTGIGMSIAANKVSGAMAARCGDTYSARMARAHNGANILCLGERVLGVEIARDVLRAFLATPVDQDQRHAGRREKIRRLEAD